MIKYLYLLSDIQQEIALKIQTFLDFKNYVDLQLHFGLDLKIGRHTNIEKCLTIFITPQKMIFENVEKRASPRF